MVPLAQRNGNSIKKIKRIKSIENVADLKEDQEIAKIYAEKELVEES